MEFREESSLCLPAWVNESRLNRYEERLTLSHVAKKPCEYHEDSEWPVVNSQLATNYSHGNNCQTAKTNRTMRRKAEISSQEIPSWISSWIFELKQTIGKRSVTNRNGSADLGEAVLEDGTLLLKHCSSFGNYPLDRHLLKNACSKCISPVAASLKRFSWDSRYSKRISEIQSLKRDSLFLNLFLPNASFQMQLMHVRIRH